MKQQKLKQIININLSKDTPAETLSALYAALKHKEQPADKLFALNEDIEKLHERYEQLFKQVKTSANLSENQIEIECDTLSRKYKFELEELSKLRKVDYDIQQAKIKAKEKEQTPWRRSWWWRLIFQPLTNRAQDIIEQRAELEADIIHSNDEKAIEFIQSKQLPPDDYKAPTKRELKKQIRKELKKVIKQADNADVREAFAEPIASPASTDTDTQYRGAQLPGQLSFDDVTAPAQNRRPRPPKNCRKK